MQPWVLNTFAAAGSVLLSLIVTYLFNKLVGLPTELRKQKAAEKAREEKLQKENADRDAKIQKLQEAVDALPGYRMQSLQIQAQLQAVDKEILAACSAIKQGVADNQHVLNDRLDRLEKREKNAIRAKLLDEYRLFTDESKNPLHAWTEMEQHAFSKLVEDYEDLGGNDYVHSDVLPAMNQLEVVRMEDKQRLLDLMSSRRL